MQKRDMPFRFGDLAADHCALLISAISEMCKTCDFGAIDMFPQILSIFLQAVWQSEILNNRRS